MLGSLNSLSDIESDSKNIWWQPIVDTKIPNDLRQIDNNVKRYVKSIEKNLNSWDKLCSQTSKLSEKTKSRESVIKYIEPVEQIWKSAQDFLLALPLKTVIISYLKATKYFWPLEREIYRFGVSQPMPTFRQIMKILENPIPSDIEVLTPEFKLSLICPISCKIIAIPARFIECKHIECFDLESFIKLNEETTRMRCPICKCNKSIIFSGFPQIIKGIAIDGFVQNILKSTEYSCDSVLFDKRGLWRKIKDRPIEVITID